MRKLYRIAKVSKWQQKILLKRVLLIYYINLIVAGPSSIILTPIILKNCTNVLLVC